MVHLCGDLRQLKIRTLEMLTVMKMTFVLIIIIILSSSSSSVIDSVIDIIIFILVIFSCSLHHYS